MYNHAGQSIVDGRGDNTLLYLKKEGNLNEVASENTPQGLQEWHSPILQATEAGVFQQISLLPGGLQDTDGGSVSTYN